jgi:hypothetical protein
MRMRRRLAARGSEPCADQASCRGLQPLTGLKKLWGLGMEPYFLRSVDKLLADLVLLRRLAGLPIRPRQGG